MTRKRKISIVILFIAIMIIGIVVTKSSKISKVAGGIVGCYVGSYCGGIETINIRADNTFDQTFVKGSTVIYSNKGEFYMDRDKMIFSPFIEWEVQAGKFTKCESLVAKFDSSDKPYMIVIFAEDDYYLDKIK